MTPPRRGKTNLTPYFLLLPSTLFLILFFAWPMFQTMVLAFRGEGVILNLREAPENGAAVTGQIRQSAQVILLGNRGIPVAAPAAISAEEEAPSETGEEAASAAEPWYLIRGLDMANQAFEGWVPASYIREDEPETEGGPFTSGSVRRRDRDVRSEPGPISPVVAQVAQDTAVEIAGQRTVEIWYEVQGQTDSGETVTGWAPSRYLEVLSTGGEQVTGFVNRGDSGEWTLRYIERMFADREFIPALITTLLLIVLILPIQFLLAFIMALLLQSRLRGNTLFLYVFSIPLATSDLAVGIIWFSVFTQSGFLNSLLQGLGLITSPIVYLSVESKHFMILAVVLAEVWRATSIVMVIIVSGLQAVPESYLEAAELFGASLWQRVRYVILPLLKPSLQVALILRTILAFQVFGVVLAIAGRGMTVLANEAYRWYVEFRNPNMAAAYSGFILLLSMITAIFYLRSIRTQEEARE